MGGRAARRAAAAALAIAAGLAAAGRPAAAGQIPAADPPAVACRIEPVAPPLDARFAGWQIGILEKLNRRDHAHLIRIDEMIVPDAWPEDELAYSPLPRHWAWAAAWQKALIVHQPAQVFGAYEGGRLVRWGPVSTGRTETPTPEGLFHLNWKSRERRSTENEAWLLKWYFNFINTRGISFHEFDLPGYAASHACVRLLARDAEWIYHWGDQWQLTPDGQRVFVSGTPVVVAGAFDAGAPPPWLRPDACREPLVLPGAPDRPAIRIP